ncbi:RNA polymerase sigma factor [Spirosoma utsteinense]|uniref:RNA polymerase sigma-70 factor (ECF subfamily) n=1 Tax=Spirosoma utsteinense TaxID=2585773 RepID=A0ABR6WAQ1_9BACT|nr:sigma-70 family RNA polymerase sigma factor [Spirosoma utsteinense]MBC3787867.1 RNA polymerase sigma-70 factor (ECF subfamily) [Spirosoma utsteinense]MBC3793655.1 RNA polymerase sigma-70 factor (ECF subfamily) [Spirosoma utsteinense]
MDSLLNYQKASDTQIWDDFLLGSKDAYSFMYTKYAPVLYNYGYKIAQDRQLTEDCLQDLFLTILETRERLGHTDSIKFYLMRSLRREIVRKLTSGPRLTGRHMEQHRLADGHDIDFRVEFQYEPTWLDSQISKERSEAILHELNRLPARQKEALFLKFFDNLSYDEIAGIMGIETTSAYKVIYKAIAALQKRMPADLLALLVIISQ